MISAKSVATCLGFSTVLVFVGLISSAQEPAKQVPASAKPGGTAKRKVEAARRVPDYFGQIGLSADQREKIYQVRSKHQTKIDELERQIDVIREEMLKDCESVLTDTQKKLLENLRKGARGTRSGSAPSEFPKAGSGAKGL